MTDTTGTVPPKKKRNITAKVAGVGAMGVGLGMGATGLGVMGLAHQIPRMVAKGSKFETIRNHPAYYHAINNKRIQGALSKAKIGGVGIATLGLGTMYAGYKSIRAPN